MPNHARLLEETVRWGREQNRLTSEITDRLALKFGLELAEIVPGRVSTEVDADLSFDSEGTAAKARAIISEYEKLGLSRERVLIKIAATWEGIRAAKILQGEGIDCNMTLTFSLTQAAACADAGVFLISPFIGRILDWYSKAEGKSYTGNRSRSPLRAANLQLLQGPRDRDRGHGRVVPQPRRNRGSGRLRPADHFAAIARRTLARHGRSAAPVGS
jgi:transaldolase